MILKCKTQDAACLPFGYMPTLSLNIWELNVRLWPSKGCRQVPIPDHFMLSLTHTDLFKQQVSYLPLSRGKVPYSNFKILGLWGTSRCVTHRSLNKALALLCKVLLFKNISPWPSDSSFVLGWRVIPVLPRAQQILKGILDSAGLILQSCKKKDGLDNKYISI